MALTKTLSLSLSLSLYLSLFLSLSIYLYIFLSTNVPKVLLVETVEDLKVCLVKDQGEQVDPDSMDIIVSQSCKMINDNNLIILQER